MKIVNVIGGLGNQMFQYAFALSLKDKFPDEDILIDTQHFNYLFLKKYKSCNLHNGYEINKVFKGTSLPVASRKELRLVTRYIPNYLLSRVVRRLLANRKTEYVEDKNYVFYPEVYDIQGSCYYEGYWQSARFHEHSKEVIRNEFSFGYPNAYNFKVEEQIKNSSSVGIHVRRGDYLLDPEYTGICDLDYYKRAIEKIGANDKTFFIFSNDIQWCKNNLLDLLSQSIDVFFVDGNKGKDSPWDMYLMSKCEHLIIANSSFSWWGAFLNKDVKTVIAPRTWINRDYEIDVYMDDWIKL